MIIEITAIKLIIRQKLHGLILQQKHAQARKPVSYTKNQFTVHRNEHISGLSAFCGVFFGRNHRK